MTVYIGIDWSQSKHDVCFVDETGQALARVTLAHSVDGFHQLESGRRRLNVAAETCRVGIETAHHLLVDWLWGHGYRQVYVIPPSVVKRTRGRYRQSGARTDQSDAYLLADLLRTDRRRWQPWCPDSLLTRQLRSRVSYIGHLTRSVVRMSNRLRAVLGRYYPAALNLFSDVTTLISLEFVRAYPTPQAAAALSLDEFRAFTQRHGYRRPQQLPQRFARLQQPYPEADADTVAVFCDEAVALAGLLQVLLRAKQVALRELHELFQQHPDAPVFDSLPGAGPYLAPALLAKFGDDRRRFPTAASVQALAGTCPVTAASGKRRVVRFRWACDHEFRSIVQTWAIASLVSSTWANAYWHQVRPRCHSQSHAYRCLGNRWLAILWKCWQTRQPYDEAYHLQRRATRGKSHAQA